MLEIEAWFADVQIIMFLVKHAAIGKVSKPQQCLVVGKKDIQWLYSNCVAYILYSKVFKKQRGIVLD